MCSDPVPGNPGKSGDWSMGYPGKSGDWVLGHLGESVTGYRSIQVRVVTGYRGIQVGGETYLLKRKTRLNIFSLSLIFLI